MGGEVREKSVKCYKEGEGVQKKKKKSDTIAKWSRD
jgi:hypothetical protein